MTLRLASLGLLLGVGLLGCARPPKIDLNWTRDPRARFLELHSFAWMPGPRLSAGEPRVDDALLEKRIREAVDHELGSKGYQRKLLGEPDFYVAHHVYLGRKLDVRPWNSRYGFDPAWGWHHRGSTGSGRTGRGPAVAEYENGTLALDIIHAANSHLIWRGIAQARLDLDRDKERKKIERINEAVRRLLERFPSLRP